jgi:hypothetical protein
MSHAPIAAAPSRPTLVDYVFLLAGSSLSLYLLNLHPLLVQPTRENLPPRLYDALAFLPTIMRVPEGILLLGPIFFLTQFGRRRGQGLTALEWLWALSWLGISLLTALDFWDRSGTLPELMHPYAALPRKLWYLVFVPSLAALAAILGLFGMLRRGASPWTHMFSLVLLLWPIAPLVCILSLGKFL